MDYLDRKKQLRHRVIMLVGYVCLAIAITITTLVLLYQAYGFGIGTNGTVIQNGLTFFSSHPNPANIYINGLKKPETTNTRLVLPEGIYKIKLARNGYRDWQRSITLEGGQVEHFDYPFLFPNKLSTSKVRGYNAPPPVMTQSPDRHWLVIQQPGATAFDVYDLKNITKPPSVISLPANVFTKAVAPGESFQVTEWASDNKHFILQHDYDNKTEFILVDRADPTQSVNLNAALAVNPTQISLRDKKYDRYYLYNAPTGTLRTAELKTKLVQPLLDHVLAYKSYGENDVLYATDDKAPPAKAAIRLVLGDKTVNIRNLPASPSYLLDLAKYSGDMYVALGASNGDKVYIYKDPAGQVAQQPGQPPTPVQVLHVPQPNRLSFSSNAQFIVAENGNHFGVYDIENETGHNYVETDPIDPPQSHADWMDGNRLLYVSGGKLVVFDYDNNNQQQLMPAASGYLPAFDVDYKYAYTLARNPVNGQFELTRTALLTPADL